MEMGIEMGMGNGIEIALDRADIPYLIYSPPHRRPKPMVEMSVQGIVGKI